MLFGKEKITKEVYIDGMSCMHCAAKVEKALACVSGVANAKVDLENKKAVVNNKTKNHPPHLRRRVIIFYTVNGSMPFVFVGRILNVKLNVLSFTLYFGSISGPHAPEPVPVIL